MCVKETHFTRSYHKEEVSYLNTFTRSTAWIGKAPLSSPFTVATPPQQLHTLQARKKRTTCGEPLTHLSVDSLRHCIHKRFCDALGGRPNGQTHYGIPPGLTHWQTFCQLRGASEVWSTAGQEKKLQHKGVTKQCCHGPGGKCLATSPARTRQDLSQRGRAEAGDRAHRTPVDLIGLHQSGGRSGHRLWAAGDANGRGEGAHRTPVQDQVRSALSGQA